MVSFFSKLSVRERWFVAVAAVFVGAALLFALVVNPVLDQKQRYARMVEEKRRDLMEFYELAAQFRTMRSSLGQLEKKVTSGGSNMSLLAAMESNARKMGLAERIASMKPFTTELESGVVQSSVEIRVEKVDLKGLVRFMEAMEAGPNMAVTTRLRIKTRFDDPSLLDATVLITTLETG